MSTCHFSYCRVSGMTRTPGATWPHSQRSTLSAAKKGLHYDNPEPSFQGDNCVGSKGTGATDTAPVNVYSLFRPRIDNHQGPTSSKTARLRNDRRKAPDLVPSGPPPLPLVTRALVGQVLDSELICATTVSTASTTSGPLGGQGKKGKWGTGRVQPASWR